MDDVIFNKANFVDLIKISQGKDHFLITKKSNFKYLEVSLTKNLFFTDKNELNNPEVLALISKFDIIFIFYLGGKTELVKLIPNHIKLVWVGWGVDYMDYVMDKFDKYDHITKKYYKLFDYAVRLKALFSHKPENYNYLERFDFIHTIVPEEYQAIQKRNKGQIPKYIDWSHGSIEDTNSVGLDNIDNNQNNILIGNSLTWENNHLEVFKYLSNFDLGNKKVIVPISYGSGGRIYRKILNLFGKYYLGKNYNPLNEYLKLKDYNKIISSCKTVFMNHIRQQGVGNIISAIYSKTDLFLNKKGMVYKHLTNSGLCIKTLKDFKLNTSTYSNQELEHNKNRIYEMRSYSTAIEAKAKSYKMVIES